MLVLACTESEGAWSSILSYLIAYFIVDARRLILQFEVCHFVTYDGHSLTTRNDEIPGRVFAGVLTRSTTVRRCCIIWGR